MPKFVEFPTLLLFVIFVLVLTQCNLKKVLSVDFSIETFLPDPVCGKWAI